MSKQDEQQAIQVVRELGGCPGLDGRRVSVRRRAQVRVPIAADTEVSSSRQELWNFSTPSASSAVTTSS